MYDMQQQIYKRWKKWLCSQKSDDKYLEKKKQEWWTWNYGCYNQYIEVDDQLVLIQI